MKNFFLFMFIFSSFLASYGEESMYQLSQRGENLWIANDYTGASSLYEQLIQLPLPSWQKARLFYNLGTLRLAQHRTTDALDFFQKISPYDLSLRRFGRDLWLNRGIAYWQYAQTEGARSNPFSLDLQALFIKQSLNAFNEAQLLDCQIQEMEQEELSVCSSYPLIIQWTKIARLHLHALYQQKRQRWIEEASIEMLASFLYDHLKRLSDDFVNFQNQQLESTKKTSLMTYLKHQRDSFSSIWKALEQKSLTLDQKKIFDQAFDSWLKGGEALKQHDLNFSLKEFNQSIEALLPLTFKENKAFQQAYLNFEIFLLQDNLTTNQLQDLLTQFNELKVEPKQQQRLDQIKQNLEISLEALELKDVLRAHFFLLVTLSQLEDFHKPNNPIPLNILQHVLSQAYRSYQLYLLLEWSTDDFSKKQPLLNIVKKEQGMLIKTAHLFIPAVLQEQKKRFEKAQNLESSCQQIPWEQVIPLFDQGLKAAQEVEKKLNLNSLRAENRIIEQKQTIKSWEKALFLLLHPPKQNPQNVSSSQSFSHSPSMNETFRLIQEMYLEDQFLPEPTQQELNTW